MVIAIFARACLASAPRPEKAWTAFCEGRRGGRVGGRARSANGKAAHPATAIQQFHDVCQSHTFLDFLFVEGIALCYCRWRLNYSDVQHNNWTNVQYLSTLPLTGMNSRGGRRLQLARMRAESSQPIGQCGHRER